MVDKTMDRRSLLGGGAALAAGGLIASLAGCTADDARAGDESPTATPTGADGAGGDVDLSDWAAVRSQFALDPDLAHFAAFVLASHPAPVRAAIQRWREAFDADPAAMVEDELRNDDAVRIAAAEYLGANTDEVALTDSTTMGLALVYQGLDLRPGDHVLATTHDFYSTHEALRLVAARTGADVRQISLYDEPSYATADDMVARLTAHLRPETRVVSLTWVHSGTGVKIPVRAIADALAEANADRDPDERAIVILDAIHGLGAEADTPADLGCDVFVSGTHKWMFGPRGTGIVWAHRDAGARIRPTIPSFSSPAFTNWLSGRAESSPFGVGITPGGYQAFEHRWAAADAFAFHQAIGRDRIAARTQELATRLKAGLADIRGVRLVTPVDPAVSSGLVCCALGRQDPDDVVRRLREDHQIVAGVTPYRDRYVRFGTSIVTTPEQVDDLIDAVAAIV